MHAFVTITAMVAIFAAHVMMAVELRPRGGKAKDDTENQLGETP